MDYFNGCFTVEQIKSRFRELAMEHHPDRGGDTATMQEVIAKVDELLRSGIIREGVDAYIIGTWIWTMGDTRPHKETLKGMGFRWSGERQRWYWHDGTRKFRRSGLGLDSIAARYGASKVAEKEGPQLRG